MRSDRINDLVDRYINLIGDIAPCLDEARAIEAETVALLPETNAAWGLAFLSQSLERASKQATVYREFLLDACRLRSDTSEEEAKAIYHEVEQSPLVIAAVEHEDAAMRSGSVTRRNDASGARYAAVLIETYKRLPDDLKPWYCSPRTVETHRQWLRLRGIQVDRFETA